MVRVFYVSTDGLEQRAFELEPGVVYADDSACPADVWRARTLGGLLLGEHLVEASAGVPWRPFVVASCASAAGADDGAQQQQCRRQRPKDLEGQFAALGLEPSSGEDFERVQRAFRKLSLQHHPDKGGSVEKMTALSEAYTALSHHFQCNLA